MADALGGRRNDRPVAQLCAVDELTWVNRQASNVRKLKEAVRYVSSERSECVKKEMMMDVVSRLGRTVVCLAGIALAGTVLAESSPAQNVPPQPDCDRRGYGPGPGMMGGSGYGPGMMGYGAGPGMMRGYGMGMGMGPGMMMPGAWAGGLELSDEQRTKINQIQDETRKTHWALMGSMMDQQAKLRDFYDAPKRDSAAIDSAYKTIDGIRQQMLSSSVDARKRIEAVLTRKQLEKLRTYQSQQDELGW